MFKKILLLICVAFVVVCYGYPCLILPFGSYTGEIGEGEYAVEMSVTFGFDGKAKVKMGELETERYYKLNGNELILSEDDKFDDNDEKLVMSSMYSFNLDDVQLHNNVGMYMTIGVGVLAVVLILMPSKRK